jgi:HD-GYP domain-containing protein (c-di-GMP phosphodiesterase class II)
MTTMTKEISARSEAPGDRKNRTCTDVKVDRFAEQATQDTSGDWDRIRAHLLDEINSTFWASAKLPEMVDQVVRLAQHSLMASTCSVILANGHGHKVFFEVCSSDGERELVQTHVDNVSGAAKWVTQHCKPLLLNDVTEREPGEPVRLGEPKVKAERILCIPLTVHGRTSGALRLTRTLDNRPFTQQDLATAELIGSMAAVALENTRLRQSVEDGYRTTIRALAGAIDAKDPYTCGHSQRVAEYALVAGVSLGLDESDMATLEYAAVLHDVGKIGIDDAILRKPMRLSVKEHAIVCDHPVIGAAIVNDIPFLRDAADLILHHHEHYDGSGYPHGLSGPDIPLGSRIIGIGDAFDTMITDRPYRRALTLNEAMTELYRCRGTQFCPEALDAFASGFSRHYDDVCTLPHVLARGTSGESNAA